MNTCSACAYAGPRMGYEDHECRRRAPVAERVDAAQDLRQWVPRFPVMKAGDWCGDFANRPIPLFTPKKRGDLAGDGKPCPNDHDPECRWPQCNCRQWGQ